MTQALKENATLTYSALTLPELAHNTEKAQLKIFNRTQASYISPKDFRHNYPQEQALVVSEVVKAWNLVKSYAICAENEVNETIADAALQRLSTQALDGYDLLMLEAIDRANVGQIKVITGDRD